MPFYLLLLFIVIPLLELKILWWIGERIGILPTLGLVIVTGTLGAILVKHQGLKVLAAFKRELAAGRLPTDPLLSGLLVLLGGAFLITPGMLTDLVGLLLMIPGNRRLLIRWIKRRLVERFHLITIQTPITILPDDLEGNSEWRLREEER